MKLDNVLAIDSSTDRLSLAVQRAGRVYAFDGEGGAAASATMLARIAELLTQADLTVGDLDAVAFGQGPGAFTGLRAACAVAQGLAVSARVGGIPVVPINTLMACAQAARTATNAQAPLLVAACMDARMNEVYTAAYQFSAPDGGDTLPTEIMAPALCKPDQVWSVHAQATTFAGNALAVYGDALGAAPAEVPWCAVMPTASALLALVPAVCAAGGAVPAALARPLYVRDKVAQTTAERMALKALQAAQASQASDQ
jgi:tRNA threonylcarbamoyladenosine biosynthesis protein TsaB